MSYTKQMLRMDKIQHKLNIDQLIQDDSFILWSLLPADDLEQTWIRDYLILYPEEKENIERARDKVRSLKFNRQRLSSIEKDSLKQTIKKDLIKRQKSKKIRLIWQYAAACILCISILGSLYLMNEESTLRNDENPFLTNIDLDSGQTEVELHLPQEKIQVADNATISINHQGNVNVEDKKIKNIELIDKEGNRKADKNNTKETRLNVLSVPEGRRSSLILPDGTKVLVNSGTILQFPEVFDKDKRVIFLEGEAYMEVAKDASRPFYVKTNQMEVKVLGTSFCVIAYKDENYQSVVLKEGSVSVEGYNAGKQIIKPNDQLILENGQMSVNQVNIYDHISWIDGILQFQEKDLGEVLRSLSRYYRVRFSYSADIESLKCTGKLVLFDNIDQVFQTLQKSLSISFRYEGEIIEVKNINNKK